MPAPSASDHGYNSPDPPRRHRRQRNALNGVSNTGGTGGGILSNVISFVSREIGEFVVTATGGVEVRLAQRSAFVLLNQGSCIGFDVSDGSLARTR